MKHLIMGTAGHIDHGKTALIQALTGIDCDTHKEEKRRGITINLGFAHLDLPSGDRLGIVDVPGHQDFVHTMVGGASGIDFALLVVAADSGVMPQTREHLEIMDVLGIGSGLGALTKVDLVDQEIASVAGEEVRDLVRGTFLEDCLVANVSAVTGEGVDALKQCIGRVASEVPDRPTGEVFRMFVDRIFTIGGFGTVVTGSVMSGVLRTGDKAYLLPGGKKDLRVRRIERHGEGVDQAVPGDRASIALAGLDREGFRRGMIVSDRVLRETTMIDVRLRLFNHVRGFELWSQVLFHVGTFESLARVHLIDGDRMSGGETALAQIHLSAPCVVLHGDRFVVRSSSNDLTLGGGEVIDAAPLHHRRRPPQLIKRLTTIAEGALPELVFSEVRKRFGAVGHLEIADVLSAPAQEVLRTVSGGLPGDIVSYSSGEQVYLVPRSEHDRLKERILKSISGFHRRNPLTEEGRTTEELLGICGIERDTPDDTLLRLVLEEMESDGDLKRVGHTWALKAHQTVIGPEIKQDIRFVEDYLKHSRMQAPLMSDLSTEAKRHGIEAYQLDHILRHLVSVGSAYVVEDTYLHASVVDRSRKALLGALAERPKGLTVAEFRDLVEGNRKICLLLLAIYDREGVIERTGDLRVVTDKGREMLAAWSAK